MATYNKSLTAGALNANETDGGRLGSRLDANQFHSASVSSANISRSSFSQSRTAISPNASSRSSGIGTVIGTRINIFPIAGIDRYKQNIIISETRVDDEIYEIQPLTRDFSVGGVSGWVPLTHPEGALYFRNQNRRIYTDAYLYDQQTLNDINAFVLEIDAMAVDKSICLEDASGNAELVLELFRDEKEVSCGYYFVDHSTRCLFWLHKFDASFILEEVKGIAGPNHIKQEIESQYWLHWEYFPNDRDVSSKIISELKQIMMHATGDTATSTASTGPYDSQELETSNNLVDNIEPGSESSAWLVGRLMAAFTHHRFLHFYGQHGARLSRTQTVHGWASQRSVLITLLSPFLFYAPHVHLKSLEKLWVDNLISLISWRSFISKLNEEWTEFTLYGTVLLNANVAFLAIPSIAPQPDQQSRDPAEIASYLSIATSVGAIILGLLLVRQNRTKNRETADEAAMFLHQMTNRWFGLEILAIMYSLPYTLLMWGMLYFLIAVSIMCFSVKGTSTQIFTGPIWSIVGSLVLWCIWTGWERGGNGWVTNTLKSCRRKLSQLHTLPA